MGELRVLTWNLFHGRSVPETRGPLLAAFADRLAGWDWDVALLQEVLPWWPAALAARAGAVHRTALTSRNELLCLTRPIARRRPDLIKSWAGGANAILVRGHAIAEHRRRRLRMRPERRVLHGVRLDAGIWVANLHASRNDEDPGRRDVAEGRETALRWAGDAPLVLGGDFNVVHPDMPGLVRAAAHHVDHVFARGLDRAAPGATLERGILSDHAPVLARLSFPHPPQPGGRAP